MHLEIREDPFDPWQELAAYQQGGAIVPGSYGACATFIGTMRDFNQGENVAGMKLEYYQGMTEKLLGDFGRGVEEKHALLGLLVLHRVGEIQPADSIVLVAAWSAHRAEAFAGCREMMEHLKSNATFWKKETMAGESQEPQQRWVDNISG